MKVLLISEGSHELGGALQKLTQRLNEKIVDPHPMTIHDLAFRGTHGKGRRYLKRAVRCLRYAEENGFDAVIVLIDQDNDSDRREQFSQAQEYLAVSIKRAFGVAIQTFDAWMLADETALSAILDTFVPTQPDPEQLNDAKHRCKAMLDSATTDLTQSQLYASAAEHIRLDILEKRCPNGFAVFADRVRAI